MMKGSSNSASALVASVLTVSTVALSSYAGEHDVALKSCANQNQSMPSLQEEKRGDEKFAPRFDGLRFIETLVTAHR